MAPLFVLRDGRKREFALMPDGINDTTYTDRRQNTVHVLLDPASEKLLLACQPHRRQPSRRLSMPNDAGGIAA